jgi:hypothetical protein
MKLKQSLIIASLLLVAFACKDGYLDDINKVDPGEDVENPDVSINFPIEGSEVRALTDVMPINIRVAAADDIEVKTIKVSLDGTEIGLFDAADFIDYRNAEVSFTHPTLNNGAHVLSVTATDAAGKTSTETVNFEKVPPYEASYDGEIFYMPFDGDYTELVTLNTATKVGLPTFSEDNVTDGKSYKGVSGGYVTYPISGLTLGEEFSVSFWYKINAAPDRAGIISISAPNPDVPGDNNLKTGFRLFREGSATNQAITANVGFGTDGAWITGAAINPTTTTGWVHIVLTIAPTRVAIYFNGNVASQKTDFTGIVWPTDAPLSIASGMPNFKAWNHLSDASLIDEIRIFNKALTEAEVEAIYEDVVD